MTQSHYAISSQFSVRSEEFGALIFNRQSWYVYHTNQTGHAILQLLSRRKVPRPAILEHIGRTCGLISDDQASSIDGFLDQLLRLGVIQETSGTKTTTGSPAFETQSRLTSAFGSREFAASRREGALLRNTPFKHGFQPESESRASLVPRQSIGSGDGTSHSDGLLARYLRAPIFVWWDITALCNLRCKQCYSNSGIALSDELSFSEVCATLEQLAQMKVFYVYFLGGEPFLREDFRDIVRYSRDLNLEVMISTNGWFITPQLAKELAALDVRHVRVSIDGATAETHDKIRGVNGSFDRALKAISNLKSAGVTVVGITPTVMHENVREAEMLIDLAYKLDVDEIQLVQVCAVGRGREVTPLDLDDIAYLKQVIVEKSSEIGENLQITGSEGIWEKPFSRCVMNGTVFPQIMGCGGGRTCLAISSNGRVRACLMFQHEVGDLRRQDFQQIWVGDNPNLLWLRQTKEGCQGCTYASICSGPCPMQQIISSEQRECFIREDKRVAKDEHKCSEFLPGGSSYEI